MLACRRWVAVLEPPGSAASNQQQDDDVHGDEQGRERQDEQGGPLAATRKGRWADPRGPLLRRLWRSSRFLR